jgi:GDP-L-fucose synthase
MKEEYLLSGPIEPTNEPFAVAKIAGIKMCQAYNRQYKTKFICCVPATAYGPGDHFGPNGHVVSGLFERMHQARVSGKKDVVVWGSGKPKREFMYVEDIAGALIFLLQKCDGGGIMHIGAGRDTSIKELAGLIKEVVGFKGKLIFDTTKPDGNSRRLLDSRELKKLGWKAATDLSTGLQLTYQWYKTQTGGK